MKKIISIICLVSVLAFPIKIDAKIARGVQFGDGVLNISSITRSHTISETNPILFIATYKQNSQTVNSVTWNGTSLTRIQSAVTASSANIDLWYLAAPASGTHNLVVTASGSSGWLIYYGNVYSGAKQTSPLDGSARDVSAPFLPAVTTGTDGCWAHAVAFQTSTAGTNATLLQSGDMELYDTYGYGTIAPGTAFSMGVSITNPGGIIMATFKSDGLNENTCSYSGTGDWNVLESDNCYITGDTYVNGQFNLIGSTTGAFGCSAAGKVSATKFNFGTNKTTFDMDCFAHHN